MPKILVADDNTNIQRMVSLAFEGHGIEVVAVGNGEAAVRRLPDLKPDVVLADVFMPVRNGYEVCEFVKKDPRFSEVPVILLVGAFDPLDENEARRVGADGILKKPFVPPDPLIAMVTSALEKISKTGVAPQTPAPFSEVPPPKPAPPAPPAPVAVEDDETASEEELYAYGTGRRDLDEEVVKGSSAPVDLRGEEVTEEEPESRLGEESGDWRRRDAMELSELEETTPTKVEADAAEPEVVTAAPLPAEEVRPAEEEEREEARLPATTPPETSPEFSAIPTEWMEMMAPPPPAEHPMAWSVPPESPALPERLATISEVPKPKAAFFAPAEPRDSLSATEPPNVAPEEGGLEHFGETESAAPSTYGDAGVEKAAPYEFMEPPVAPYATDEPDQAEEIGRAALEHQDAQAVAAHPNLSLPAETLVSGSPPLPSSSMPVDTSTVDAVVEQVLQKLEARLHDFLASGILRPIVEEALQEESNKKK